MKPAAATLADSRADCDPASEGDPSFGPGRWGVLLPPMAGIAAAAGTVVDFLGGIERLGQEKRF